MTCTVIIIIKAFKIITVGMIRIGIVGVVVVGIAGTTAVMIRVGLLEIGVNIIAIAVGIIIN